MKKLKTGKDAKVISSSLKKNPAANRQGIQAVVASPRRFERLTPSLGGKCSIQLSYGDSA